MYRKIGLNLQGWMLLIGSLFWLIACSMVASEEEEDFVSKAQNASGIEIVDLVDHGPAAEWKNQVWLNTEQPLRLQALRGKVVLLDFWTFG